MNFVKAVGYQLEEKISASCLTCGNAPTDLVLAMMKVIKVYIGSAAGTIGWTGIWNPSYTIIVAVNGRTRQNQRVTVFVVAIGKRDRSQAYDLASQRLDNDI